MNITETVKRSLRFVAMAGVVIAAFSLASCSDDDEKEESAIEKHNVEFVVENPLSMTANESLNNLLDLDRIKKLASADDVDSLIILSDGSDKWKVADALVMKMLKDDYMKPIFDAVPNAYGKGSFNFKLGEASKVPNDSIWYVNHGFTINANLKK
ncbi:MAG: hypothetical protein MJ069_03155 [Salinivirgaceae bacterium]|nr:hypothetical protein [Salinivirgaceae bacterium]